MDQGLKEFYLTLPSWTSNTFFPNNSADDYYVKLPKPIRLYGEWKVGMSRLNLQKMWYNVREKGNYLNINVEGDLNPIQVNIPYGYYENIHELVMELNEALSKNLSNQDIFFGYDMRRKRMYVSFNTTENLSMVICKGLSQLMGFTVDEVIVQSKYANNLPNMEMDNEYLLVNCDIVEEQTVGGLKTPMIGYLYTKGTDYGESLPYTVDTQYIGLRNKIFEVIHIWTSDLKGNRIDSLSTRTVVQLHFYR